MCGKDWTTGSFSCTLSEQVTQLNRMIPGIGFPNSECQRLIEDGSIHLPEGADRWVAIPNREKNPVLFGECYLYAFCKISAVFALDRDLRNFNFNVWDHWDQFIQTHVSEIYFREISKRQSNPDILIVPAQVGSRKGPLSPGEYGLGVFGCMSMLLTHPHLLEDHESPAVICSGDLYRADKVLSFLHDGSSSVMFVQNISEVKWSECRNPTGFLF